MIFNNKLSAYNKNSRHEVSWSSRWDVVNHICVKLIAANRFIVCSNFYASCNIMQVAHLSKRNPFHLFTILNKYTYSAASCISKCNLSCSFSQKDKGFPQTIILIVG